MAPRARALAAAALAAALAAPPAAAQAQTRHRYDARFDVKVYLRTSEATEVGKVTREQTTSFRVSGTVKGMEFVDGKLVTSRTANGVVTGEVSATERHVNNWENPPLVRTCGNGDFTTTGISMMYPLAVFDPQAGPLTVVLIPFTSVEHRLVCNIETPQLIGFGARMHGPRTRTRADDHFRVTFTIPRDDFGDHTLDLKVAHHSESIETCPGRSDKPDLRACVSDVRGTVRLTRTFMTRLEPDDDLLAPLTPVKASVDRRARRAEVKVRCPNGCGVRIRIFLPPRRGRGRLGRAAAADTLATRSVRLGPDRAARTVEVAIPPAARPRILAAGMVLFDVSLDPPSGRTVRRTLPAIPGR
ncbi:hypothetical protein [Conexibacter woesei]|uniref:Uncharacterized protein n=1 Tax=Conexibacter woesei (strain DSM 14684 / CCUG 47730 / CIP 108061 / JCM 11494 / NBRC 100937 / ID131577) TaxID=469383 RepID=D3FDJ9_CONWI|nr:hypothetical protein [Conexibacter woesei]ADB49573.1 hypothetical protein Cwoe_1142 [Conexibacter woesei DSM 14684]